MENMTGKMNNMTRPTTCNITGRMIIFKNMENMDMENMGSMAERMDNRGPIAEKMYYLLGMNENEAIIEDMNNTNKMDEKIDNIDEMDSVTGKIILIRNVDDTTQIVTKNITCDIT
jgi:hypothetical protein